MTEFKDFAANPNPTKIFDCFVGVFVEDWLDAILGLVNNVISSKGSEFEKNLPIITGLLNSVGGFTETSALTDLFNSIFQITRDSKYSFTFEPQSSGFVGLDRDNAYFLITSLLTLLRHLSIHSSQITTITKIITITIIHHLPLHRQLQLLTLQLIFQHIRAAI